MAIRDITSSDAQFKRKAEYAMRRWHATWQLMHAFQRWTYALRIFRVGCLERTNCSSLHDALMCM